MLGEDHPQTAGAFLGLGNSLIEIDSLREAEENINKGIEIYVKKLPRDHWNVSYSESLLGKCYFRQGKFEKAERVLLKAYQNLLEKRGKNDRLTTSALKSLIKNYRAWNKPDKADDYEKILINLKNQDDDTNN